MGDVVQFDKSNLPAAFQDMEDLDVNKDLEGGMGAGFSVLSVKGGRWRLRAGGESEPICDEETGEVKPSIEVVMLKANPHYSKIFYAKNYEEGDDSAPDCFSIDGETPDASVMEPINDTCAGCPHDVWGSRITDSGEKGKKCADHRRVAVLFTEELELDPEDMEIGATLLRVPAASLKDLKLYGKGLTDAYGLPYMAVVTRLGFDPEVAYPKLTFKAVRPLSDEESHTVVAMMGAETTDAILHGNTDVIATDQPKPKVKAREVPSQKPKSVDVEFEEPAPKPKPKAKPKTPAKKKTAAKKVAAAPFEEGDGAEEAASDSTEVASAAQEDINDIMSDLDDLEL